MSEWLERIRRELTFPESRLVLALDPDGVLLDEGLLSRLQEDGVDLWSYEDPVAFRFAYEERYRPGVETVPAAPDAPRRLVLRLTDTDLTHLPYDLVRDGRAVSYSLTTLFPAFPPAVVAALAPSEREVLARVQQRYPPGALGENEAKDYLLRYIFGIAPELLSEPVAVLQLLLERHYQGKQLPALLDERLLSLLQVQGGFDTWPWARLLSDRTAFFAFLQERWPLYLDRLAGVAVSPEPAPFTVPGPAALPFEHPGIRVYMDNLFLEGLLRPVAHEAADRLSATWVGVGLHISSEDERERRLDQMEARLRESLPLAETASHTDWFRFARAWGEWNRLRHEAPVDGNPTTGSTLCRQVDATFTAWLRRHYAGLSTLSPVPPVMVHHLPKALARDLADGPARKVALVVCDGLSWEQWLVLRDALARRRPHWRFHEREVMAWAPTLTCISRQALFAGKPPFLFPDSLRTTDREPNLWRQFWAEQDVPAEQVYYRKSLGDDPQSMLEELATNPRVRVAGLVVDKVDRIMHGMELGAAGMLNQVHQWADGPDALALFDGLFEQGFSVYLTADHGNIEATGCGRPAEGVLAEKGLRGERVRLYADPALRRQAEEKFPDAEVWDAPGLPPGYYPLLAPARQAFVPPGQKVVGHGGLSLEELVVPWVRLEDGDHD